jgi:DNA-binding transcriptional ArsR family regulator
MQQLEQSENYAETLRLLSNPERLDMVSYLERESQTTMRDLSEYMEAIGYENASLKLVHQHLPLLEEHGVVRSDENPVNYDEEEVRIEYIGDEVLEEIIGTLEEL